MQAILSAGFSLVVHLLFLTLILLSAYNIQNKQDEVKVLLLDHPSTETLVPTFKEVRLQTPFSETTSTDTESYSQVKKQTQEKKDIQINTHKTTKNENTLTKSEEEFLKRRIQTLKQGKNKGDENNLIEDVAEEDLAYLQNRLAKLSSSKEGKDTSSSSPPPSLSSPVQKLSKEFLMLVKRKLQANFEVPLYLRTKSNLNAKVLIEVDGTGRIVRYRFIQSSGSSDFDSAVERCLKLSSPLPLDKPTQIVIEFYATGVGKVS